MEWPALHHSDSKFFCQVPSALPGCGLDVEFAPSFVPGVVPVQTFGQIPSAYGSADDPCTPQPSSSCLLSSPTLVPSFGEGVRMPRPKAR